MNNNSRTKRLPKIILTQLGVIVIMALLGFSILFYADGYRFNTLSFKIEKTGVVFFSTYPKGATVNLDGKVQKETTPFSQNLSAGYYDATITKTGYQPWSASFQISPELTDDYKTIVLFKSNIASKTLTDPDKIALLNAPDDILAVTSKDQITINNDEIWQNDKLVTRFSEPVLNAIWYPDGNHIIYQRGDEIRSIETDGFNDTFLVKLTNAGESKFATNENGNELYYTDGNQYKIAIIR